MNKSYEKFKQALLDATHYDRKIEPNKKVFSASMLGNQKLQNYLQITIGAGSDKTEVDASTLGSLVHTAIKQAAQARNKFMKITYLPEHRFSHTLENGWTITGSIDLIDHEYNTIFDHKVTNTKSIIKIKKEGKDHPYALQLGVYKWLLSKESDIEYKSVITAFDKQASKFNQESLDMLQFIPIDTYSPEEIEKLLTAATDDLVTYMETSAEPAQCDTKSLMWYKKPGTDKSVPMRCKFFCSYKLVCPYYSIKGELMQGMGIKKYYKKKIKK